MPSFFEELKRRNVFRVGAAYAVAAWLVIQLVETIFPAFGFGEAAVRLAVIVLGIGFVPVLILAWAFEVTPEGIKRDEDVDYSSASAANSGRKLNQALVVLLVAAVGYFAVDKFVLAPQRMVQQTAEPPASASAPTAIQARSVAVLPFVAMSRGEDDGYFADGLTEEILNSLAQLPELLVTARTSAFHFKNTQQTVPEIAAALGVANVVEGSVRRSAARVRITAQLIRAVDGFHLWSQTYDRTLEDVFAVQEDIARNIAEVLDVVLDEQAEARMRSAGIHDVEAFIAYQKGSEAFERAHADMGHIAEALTTANTFFDQVLNAAPHMTTARLMRADLGGHELFELAAGFRKEVYPGEAAAVALDLGKDYALAWTSATPGTERAIVEVERTLFTNDWRGLSAKLDIALAAKECVIGNWILQLGPAFGRAERMIQWLEMNMRCDPLYATSRLALVQALIWAGQPDEALHAIIDAEQLKLALPFVNDLRLSSLLAAGRYDDDPQAYNYGGPGDLYPFPDGFMLKALIGDPAQAREISERYLGQPGVDDYSSMLAAAMVGNRQAANAAAARIDQRPAGPFILVIGVQLCFCGAPFDLDATPNLKARIEESGLPWPPPRPINYPLKDW